MTRAFIGVGSNIGPEENIREALRRTQGNKSQAARALGLSRNALRYRLSKIGVPDSADEQSPAD